MKWWTFIRSTVFVIAVLNAVGTFGQADELLALGVGAKREAVVL